MSALDPSAPGLPLVGLGGSSLPTATGADEVPVSTGAGTTYAAQTLGDAVVTGLVANLVADDAGTAIIADGAGDVQKTSADVSAILAAASAAAARSALGLGTPTTLAAQAKLGSLLRRGPVTMRFPTTSDYVQAANTTGTTTPMLGLSTTLLVVFYAPTGGAFPGDYIIFTGSNATRGWFVALSNHGGGNDDLLIRSMASGGNKDAWINGVATTSGWHAVAFAIAADGATIRYSIDGAAAATVTPSSALTFTARLDSDAVWIGRDSAGSGGCGAGVSYVALWSSILSDSDLVALTTTPGTYGAPSSLPSAPAWEWAAIAGAPEVSVGGYRYTVSGSPRVWMP